MELCFIQGHIPITQSCYENHYLRAGGYIIDTTLSEQLHGWSSHVFHSCPQLQMPPRVKCQEWNPGLIEVNGKNPTCFRKARFLPFKTSYQYIFLVAGSAGSALPGEAEIRDDLHCLSWNSARHVVVGTLVPPWATNLTHCSGGIHEATNLTHYSKKGCPWAGPSISQRCPNWVKSPSWRADWSAQV